MEPIAPFDLTSWTGPFDTASRFAAQDALENGQVLYFPKLPFALLDDERGLLRETLSNGRTKNISRDPDGRIQGDTASPDERAHLSAMMGRFAGQTLGLILELFPGFARDIDPARTSYRPVEIAGRSYSARNDDKRVHVDAFPSRPQCGRRILRVFSNIHPAGGVRVWHVGEAFENVAKRYAAKAHRPLPLEPELFEWLGVTKGRRTAYDYHMLALHDGAKLDTSYQKTSPRSEFAFPAGTTWMCFTDQTMHAALSGQFCLEQTFHLPVEAQSYPERSPLKVLERLTGRMLV